MVPAAPGSAVLVGLVACIERRNIVVEMCAGAPDRRVYHGACQRLAAAAGDDLGIGFLRVLGIDHVAR